jgi:uncharacterized protein (TIRG00374 family)
LKTPGIFDSILDSQSEAFIYSRGRLALWISIVLAMLFLYLALRELDWIAFQSSLRNANYALIPLIFVWSSISSGLRALRWRVLLSAEKNVPIQNVFWANMAGYLGNNVLPARAGELIRAAYVSKENKLSISYSLATGLVERFMDMIALIILGSISLAVAGIVSPPLLETLKVMSAVAIAGMIGLLAVPYWGGKLNQILGALPMLSNSAKVKLGGFLEQFLRGIRALQHSARAATFVLLTSLIWLADGIGVIILAYTLHLRFTITQAFVLLAGLGLSSAIPSTPGYIGVYQFVAVILLQPFGISNTSAIAFIIFFQIASILIVAFWGGLAIWRTSLFSKS